MKLRDLEYLVAVAEERHFHKAAARCHVSQPTLSGQLKKLEDELGVLLVERTNRQVTMTEVGLAVTEQARKVLCEAKVISEISQAYQDPMKGDLHIGIIPTIAPYLLPIIMPALNKTFTKMKFWLYEYQTHILLDKLKHGELDCLILALPIEKHDFVEIDLFREPFRLAVERGNLLAKKKEITLGDIANQEMLLLEEGHCLRGHVLDVCHLVGTKGTSQFQATSLETLRHMIGEGVGMTLMPELAVPDKTSKRDLIQYLPFSDPKPNRRIGMLYRKNSYREDAFENINEVIRAALPINIFF
ncbi:MAG: DNA-binding transcriptional regulator OxyR [Sulfuriflexus sp.]|nr:DNA-binding transcriptional regulator OxyR [Sulfuriflexus sp.]